MAEIPTWLIALADLVAIVTIITHDEERRISIRVFALSFLMQFLIYVSFSLFDFTTEMRQFIARTNNVAMAVAISLILIAARTGKKNGTRN
jgi:hypothetical protein